LITKGVPYATWVRADSLRDRLAKVINYPDDYTPQQFADLLHGIAHDLKDLADRIEDSIKEGGA
jgi:DUF438 domain-containing protein